MVKSGNNHRERKHLLQVEHVATELRGRIVSGELVPGSWIRQETLAVALGTSRIPVREALRRLEAEGLVVIVPHSGARVAVLDVTEFVEIYKIRERVEALAISESIRALTDRQVSDISHRLKELEATTSVEDWIGLDRELHLATYAATPPRLLAMINSFWDTTQPYRRILLHQFAASDFDVLRAEHRLLVAAIKNRDEVAAESIVQMHIHRSRRRLETHPELFTTPMLVTDPIGRI